MIEYVQALKFSLTLDIRPDSVLQLVYCDVCIYMSLIFVRLINAVIDFKFHDRENLRGFVRRRG
jgi:hypothetical protein